MKLAIAFSILAITVLLHFFANGAGWYDMQIEAGFVWIDNVLHVFVGIAVGFFWMWVCEKYKPSASRLFIIFTSLVFVLIAAVVWELIEFAFLELFTTYAKSLQIYSPSINEAASDILSNFAGVVILIVLNEVYCEFERFKTC